MHALVTGGAGFIGSHVVDALLNDGAYVTVLDNFDPFYARSQKERNIEAHRMHPRWRIVEIDIRSVEGLETALEGSYDAIIHMAAKPGVRPSMDDPRAYQDVNVGGTQNLLE